MESFLEISLVKHSKRKNPPEKPDSPDGGTNDLPSTGPVVAPTDQARADKSLNILFWFRIGLAILGGAISEIALEPIEGEERRWTSIAILIIIFLISLVIAKGMRIPSPPASMKKLVTTGIGSYVFIFLFSWILIHTIISVLAGGGPNLPFR